jgi:hypothetical protein
MPFARSAYLYAEGEGIIHFAAIRMRLVGRGSLRLKTYSLDDEFVDDLPPITMRDSTGIEPTIPCNVMSQRIALEVRVSSVNEYFKINRIVLFGKEIYSSYPE